MTAAEDRLTEEDWGRDLCESLGLDPSVVIADTLILFRADNGKGGTLAWARYRQIVDGSPERGPDGELVTHTIPVPEDKL